MPDTISLWSFSEYEITIPRGLAHSLNTFAESYGHKIEWVDNREYDTDAYVHAFANKIDVRDYQEEAIQKILNGQQGYWKSPPGSGKTVAILEAIRRSGQFAIVIVNTTNIAEQWRQRARQYLGPDVKIGLMGDGQDDMQPITIAMQQSLWSRASGLDSIGFFDCFGFVCLDECHHLPAETFTDILSRFSAKYRIGVSGTPNKNKAWKPLVDATLGPQIHETKKDLLVQQGWLVKPSIEAYYTGFTHSFFSTHEHFGYRQNKKCFEPGCTRPDDKKRHQNNYSDVISALVNDKNRNEIIVKNIVKDLNDGHCVLVLSKRLQHLRDLKDAVNYNAQAWSHHTYMLTGKESTEFRMAVAEYADNGTCVIFSTLADEALDIPRIDRIHLAFPGRNDDLIRQQIGRGERPHPDKMDVICYDYVDSCGPLQNQYRERVRNVYNEEGLIVNERK